MNHEKQCQKMNFSSANIPSRKILFFIVFVLVGAMGHFAHSQSSITGSVQDMEGTPISFVHILLLNASDSLLVKGAVSNEDGKFSIEQIPRGEYILNSSIVGFSNFYSHKISVSEQQPDFDFGTIAMAESAEQLEGVEVISKKPLFERQADRTVINVQNSVTATGGSALDILEKSPGVSINRQSGGIVMNGKSGVMVMFDGKLSRLPLEAVVQMLSGMSSANIEKIELITAPPAKYEAEGDAGLINIVTINNQELGFNGNYGSTLGYTRAETWGANFDIANRAGGFNTFFAYNVRSDATIIEWINGRTTTVGGFSQNILSVNDRNPTTRVQNLKMGLEYSLGKKTTLSLLGTGYERRWVTDDQIATQNIISAQTTINTDATVNELNKYQSAEGSLGFLYLPNDRQSFSIEADYLYYFQNQPSTYSNSISDGSAEPELEFIDVSKETPIDFFVAKLDYSNQMTSKLFFETGAKGTISMFENKVLTSRTLSGQTTTLADFTGNSILNEDIWAAYSSMKWEPKPSWSINVGLRFEHTDTNLTTEEEGVVVQRNFGNLFPSLFVSHTYNEGNELSLAYSRRINRPKFNDLAPFVFFINPTTALSGNLTLRATITDALNFNYQWNKWSFSLQYAHAKNAIVPFQPNLEVDGDLLLLQSENLKYQSTLGLNLSRSFKITSWWEFSNYARLDLIQFKTAHLNDNPKRNVTNFSYNATSSFFLPKDYSLEISGNYQHAPFFGLYAFDPMGRLDIGLKKKLKKNWGTLTLVGTDLLHTQIWRGNVSVPEENLDTTFSYDFGLRGFAISYSNSFGNSKLKKVDIKSAAEDEKKRVN